MQTIAKIEKKASYESSLFPFIARQKREPLSCVRHPRAIFPLRSRENADPRIQVKRKDGFVLDSRVKPENDGITGWIPAFAGMTEI